jgi:hypothetical protein
MSVISFTVLLTTQEKQMNKAQIHFNNKTYTLSLFDSYWMQTTRAPSKAAYADIETIINLMHEGDDNLPHEPINFYTTFNGERVAPSTIHNLMLDNQE